MRAEETAAARYLMRLNRGTVAMRQSVDRSRAAVQEVLQAQRYAEQKLITPLRL